MLGPDKIQALFFRRRADLRIEESSTDSIQMVMEHLRTNLTYLPVVSRPNEEPVPWKGETGHVQDVWKGGAIEKAWGFRPGPENTHVFMCGSPHMSESMIEILGQEGFKEDTKNGPGQIHVEKYWQ